MLRKSIRCSYKFTQTLCIVSLEFFFFVYISSSSISRKTDDEKELEKGRWNFSSCAQSILSVKNIFVCIYRYGWDIYTHKVHCSVYIHAWKMKILASFRISSSSLILYLLMSCCCQSVCNKNTRNETHTEIKFRKSWI
jgi:hypothetical protein